MAEAVDTADLVHVRRTLGPRERLLNARLAEPHAAFTPREQPLTRVIPTPITAQLLEQRFRQRHQPILRPFALLDSQQLPLAVDIADFQRH
jgi:hypothetical protein